MTRRIYYEDFLYLCSKYYIHDGNNVCEIDKLECLEKIKDDFFILDTLGSRIHTSKSPEFSGGDSFYFLKPSKFKTSLLYDVLFSGRMLYFDISKVVGNSMCYNYTLTFAGISICYGVLSFENDNCIFDDNGKLCNCNIIEFENGSVFDATLTEEDIISIVNVEIVTNLGDILDRRCASAKDEVSSIIRNAYGE